MPFAQRSHADDGGIICRYTGGCRACWRERQTSTPLVDKQKGICDLKQKGKRKANAVCNTCSLQTKLELLLN
ncbi:hypothetical protein HII06_005227 [Escherichia coli]|nr:hypothetical protein [Escherichia coli]